MRHNPFILKINFKFIMPMPYMSDEIFAVVNERDEVIDYRPRAEIHRLHLRHRAVHIWVFNQRSELLLQKRSLRKDCSPGLWDSSAAGHVDRGEDYDACARRELAEELGITPAPTALRRWFKIDACADTGWEFVWVYACRSEGPFQHNTDEIDALAWLTLEQLAQTLKRHPGSYAGTVPLIMERLSRDPAILDSLPS